MRIGIFVMKTGDRGGGPETYELGLLRALAKVDQNHEYILYLPNSKAEEVIGIRQPNFRYQALWPSARAVSTAISLPALLLRDKVDFYHATVVPSPWSPKPLALTLHCFSNWANPDFYQKDVARRLNGLLRIGIPRAQCLFCVSDQVRQEIAKLFRAPLEKMLVTHLGVGPEFHAIPEPEARSLVAGKYGLDEPYVLFIGQYQERKNVFRVIEAFARFRAEARSQCRLLLVGRDPDPHGPIYETIQRCGVEPFVTRIRYIPHHDLPPVFAAARMVAFPSLYEGFGLPVVEAMATGTPLLTSNTTCLPEIAGDAALLVNPESVDEIAAAMTRLDTDEDLRRLLVARGLERAKKFTWENCALATLEGYERMRP